MGKFLITHTETRHPYKAGFNSEIEAQAFLDKNKTKLKKYLPTGCKPGEFVIEEDV